MVCIFHITQCVTCQLLNKIGSRDLVFRHIVRMICCECVHLVIYKNYALFASNEDVVAAVKFWADKTAEDVAIWRTCLSNIPTQTALALI